MYFMNALGSFQCISLVRSPLSVRLQVIYAGAHPPDSRQRLFEAWRHILDALHLAQPSADWSVVDVLGYSLRVDTWVEPSPAPRFLLTSWMAGEVF